MAMKNPPALSDFDKEISLENKNDSSCMISTHCEVRSMELTPFMPLRIKINLNYSKAIRLKKTKFCIYVITDPLKMHFFLSPIFLFLLLLLLSFSFKMNISK